MPEQLCGQRIDTLSRQLSGLKARREELTDDRQDADTDPDRRRHRRAPGRSRADDPRRRRSNEKGAPASAGQGDPRRRARPDPTELLPPGGAGCTTGRISTATGIRTPVSAVRGRRPSPLDDSGRTLALRRSGALDESSKASSGEAVRVAPAGWAAGRGDRDAFARENVYLRLAVPRGCGGIGRRAGFRCL